MMVWNSGKGIQGFEAHDGRGMNNFLYKSGFFFLFFILAVISQSQLLAQGNTLEDKKLHDFSAYTLGESESGEVIEYFLEAKESTWRFSDKQTKGQETKLWLYNDRLAPLLKIRKGQTLRATLKNSLSQDTTIHWHGVRLPNKMDGVPVLTQDPVEAGEEFVYEFTPKDAGTFWFHPHVRGSQQLGMGLYGILIVEEDEESDLYRNYSQEMVWALDDWRIGSRNQINPNFGNGHDSMMDGRWGNFIAINGKAGARFEAKRGERIRIRLVNTSNARIYRLKVSHLDPVIIAVDGVNVKKTFNLNRGLDLAPGNRIDIDLHIPKDFSKKVISFIDHYTQRKNVVAKIQILDEEDKNQYTFSYPENKNIPDWSELFREKPSASYTLDFKGMMMHGNWVINGRTYGRDKPYTFKKNQLHKIRFENVSSRSHPMHIHGQFFKVIAKDGKAFKEDFFRDTILVDGRETVDVVMLASDWGKWLNHCHIQEHADNGMMTSIVVE